MKKTEHKFMKLSFDKFQRYICAYRLIEFVRTEKSLKVLDVGGADSLLRNLLPDDKIYSVDLVRDAGSLFIQGDAVMLPVRDKSVDICCGIDFLEHIPENSRSAVLNEMIRVSRNFIYLGGPIYSEEIKVAEQKVNEFYRTIMGKTYSFLDEHTEHGLPTGEYVEQWMNNQKLDFSRLQFGALEDWILLMTFSLIAENENRI